MSINIQIENLHRLAKQGKEDLQQLGYQARVSKAIVICGTLEEHNILRASRCTVIPFPELLRLGFDNTGGLKGKEIIFTNSVIAEVASQGLAYHSVLVDRTTMVNNCHAALDAVINPHDGQSLNLEQKCNQAAGLIQGMQFTLAGYRKIENFLQLALEEKEREVKALAQKHARIWFVRLGKWLKLID